jgi:mRNA interferase MazF
VIPISSKVGRLFPFQVRIPAGEGGLEKESKVLCEQIRTLARERLVQPLGRLSIQRLTEIRIALDRHLWF